MVHIRRLASVGGECARRHHSAPRSSHAPASARTGRLILWRAVYLCGNPLSRRLSRMCGCFRFIGLFFVLLLRVPTFLPGYLFSNISTWSSRASATDSRAPHSSMRSLTRSRFLPPRTRRVCSTPVRDGCVYPRLSSPPHPSSCLVRPSPVSGEPLTHKPRSRYLLSVSVSTALCTGYRTNWK